MFKVNLSNGKVLRFGFEHHPGAGGYTVCRGEFDDATREGWALMHPTERQYVKRIGRKIALTDMLQLLGLNKQLRTEVWRAYHTRSHNGK